MTLLEMREEMTSTFDLVVNEIAITLDVPADSLRENTLLSDIGMDSLQGLQLLLVLEQAAQVQLDEKDFQYFKTIGSVVKLLDDCWLKRAA
jgi:acyl carrier protein